jgi:hypothetical protein
MTSYGVIKHFRDKLLGRLPVYLRLDGGPTSYREDWLRYTEWSLLHTVEDARRLGVDGVCLMAFIGAPVELRTLEIVARVAGDCAADGLPVMVEALPCPAERVPNTLDADAMASACRIAFEHGADIVKTYYTGSAASFRKVASTCPVPVLIAGGGRWIPSARRWKPCTARRWRPWRRLRPQHLAAPDPAAVSAPPAPSSTTARASTKPCRSARCATERRRVHHAERLTLPDRHRRRHPVDPGERLRRPRPQDRAGRPPDAVACARRRPRRV